MAGLLLYALSLVAVPLLIPTSWWHGATPAFVITLGVIGAWRYGWGLLHLCRSLLFRHIVFPNMRRRVAALGAAALPQHVYLLITSFRVAPETTERSNAARSKGRLRAALHHRRLDRRRA